MEKTKIGDRFYWCDMTNKICYIATITANPDPEDPDRWEIDLDCCDDPDNKIESVLYDHEIKSGYIGYENDDNREILIKIKDDKHLLQLRLKYL